MGIHVSGYCVFISVIGAYEAIQVYKADTFIYTDGIFHFSSIYRLVAMVTTFPPQVQGIYVRGHTPYICEHFLQNDSW